MTTNYISTELDRNKTERSKVPKKTDTCRKSKKKCKRMQKILAPFINIINKTTKNHSSITEFILMPFDDSS